MVAKAQPGGAVRLPPYPTQNGQLVASPAFDARLWSKRAEPDVSEADGVVVGG